MMKKISQFNCVTLRIRKLISLLKLVLFFFFAKTASGQNITTSEAAVSAALQNHPMVKAAAYEVKAKKQGEKAAFNLPNPEVNVESPTGEFYTIGVSQSFEFPTVYARQKQVAKAKTSLAQAGQRVRENELRYNVRSLYLETQVSTYMSDLWRERDTLYQQIAAAATRQFDAGEIDFLQKTIALNEAGTVAQERLASELSTSSLRVQLNILTGLADLGALEPLSNDTSGARFVVQDEGLNNPATAYQQQLTQVATQEIELAKSRALPNFSLGYMNQGERNTPLDYRFRASVGVPLWAGQYRAGQKVARAESQAALANAEAQNQSLALERQSATVEALKAWSNVQYNQKEALPRSKALITAATRMREAGQIDYVTFLRTLDEAFSIRFKYAEHVASLNSARLKMRYLEGN